MSSFQGAFDCLEAGYKQIFKCKDCIWETLALITGRCGVKQRGKAVNKWSHIENRTKLSIMETKEI